MIGHLLRKEWLEWRRDGRLWLALAILALLSLGAGLAGWQQASSQHAAAHAAADHEHERWLDQEEKHPHSAAHYGLYAFRAPGPLAGFDPGLNAYLPVTVWLEAHRQNEALYRPAQDSAAQTRFGQLTPAVIVAGFVPLLLLTLAAPAISGERERGTLRQLLLQGVSGPRLLLAKGCALTLLVIALLVPLWLLVLWLLAMSLVDGDTLLRWLLLGVHVLLAMGSLVLLGLLVSVWARSTRTALAVVLGFWVVTTLALPRMTLEAAEWRHPTPAPHVFRGDLQAALADTRELDATLARRRAELLERYQVNYVDELPVNFNAVQLQEAEEHGYPIFDEHFGRLHDIYIAQERWLQWAGWLSPFLALTTASSGLTGTDALHYRDFVERAEDHRRIIQALMNADLYENPERDGQRYLAGPKLWEQVPEFDYQPPALASLLPAYAPSLLAPVGWCLALLALLGWSARRGMQP